MLRATANLLACAHSIKSSLYCACVPTTIFAAAKTDPLRQIEPLVVCVVPVVVVVIVGHLNPSADRTHTKALAAKAKSTHTHRKRREEKLEPLIALSSL